MKKKLKLYWADVYTGEYGTKVIFVFARSLHDAYELINQQLETHSFYHCNVSESIIQSADCVPGFVTRVGYME